MSTEHRQGWTAQAATKPPPHEDPKAKLAELNAKLKASQDQIDEQTRTRDALKAEIETFGKVVSEVDKILEDYHKALPGITADDAGFQAFDQEKMGLLKCQLSDADRAKIDAAETGYLAELEAKKQKLDDLGAAAECAKSESDAALDDYNAKQAAYNEAKGYQKGITDRIAALKKLTPDINNQEAKKIYPAEYVLMRVFEDRMNAIHADLKTEGDLRTELSDAALAVNDAWEAAKAKKDAWDAATRAFDDAKKALDALWAGLNAELIRRAVAAVTPAKKDHAA